MHRTTENKLTTSQGIVNKEFCLSHPKIQNLHVKLLNLHVVIVPMPIFL